MAKFIRTRGRIRRFYGRHEIFLNRLFNGLLSFLILSVLSNYFGFAKILSHAWIVPLLSVLCAFLPVSGAALVMQVYLLIQLLSLSYGVSATLLAMLVFSYALCAGYQARKSTYIVSITAWQRLHIPYLASMQAALLGGVQEVIVIVCGAVISFYLKEVYDNAALLKSGTDALLPLVLLRDNLFGNPLFYIYVIAMAALFIVVYTIRTMNIRHAWVVAVTSGIVVEFILMLSGYLFIGQRSRIPELMVANLVTFLVGVATNYVVLDLDYTRIERVQFEDDEYYYYVTAVPKIRLAEEEKKVKRLS